jgi:tRNA pseudouridine55 synthase
LRDFNPDATPERICGFLNLHKPAGMTSFAVVKMAKKALAGLKTGHLGTLDPMVTGVLPIAVGAATRLIPYIEDHSKTYVTTLRFGGVSDTQDAWGVITPVSDTAVSREDLDQVIPEFVGEIDQIPPMYSAVNHQGKRLYELARQGIEVERRPRRAIIHRLEVEDFFYDETGARAVSLEIDCSSGTYIRTLCHDIGQKMGVGAYMTALTRVRWGEFNLVNSLPLAELEHWPAALLPVEQILHLPAVRLNAPRAEDILHGRPVKDAPGPPGAVLLYGGTGRLLALGQREESGVISPRKVFP